jgi:GTP-binding protein
MNKADPIRKAEFLVTAVKTSQFPAADRPEAAFAGRSNAGKSTLLNALARRRNLARTSRTPGRTQAINFFNINDRFYFVDLPGFGFAQVPRAVQARWGPMVEGYLSAGRDIRAVVLILDIRRDPREEEHNLLKLLAARRVPVLPVLTKMDKVNRSQRAGRAAAVREALSLDRPPLLFSGLSGEGLEDVWQTLLEALTPNPPRSERTAP